MENSSGQQKRSVGVVGVVISAVLVAAAIAGTYAWSAAARVSTEGDNFYLVSMTDYGYSPSHMTWRVGDTVTLTLVNDSPAHPAKPHEWMLGRVPNTEETVFGPTLTDGFETDFFDGVNVRLIDGADLLMMMPGLANLEGVDPSTLLAPGVMAMDMHGEGFMPLMGPSGRLTISFEVPDKPGTWTFGCFQQSGEHYLNGMHGTVTVTES